MSLKDLQANTVRVATPSEVDKVRYPDIVFSSGYLNDPIQFDSDERFSPKTVVRQFPELPSQLERDYVDFAKVNQADERVQNISVSMFATTLKKEEFFRVVLPKAQFTQF